VETIKRQTRAARVVVWLEGCKPVCEGLAYKPIGCTSVVCDVQRCSSCSCRLWCYVSVMPLPVPLLLSGYPLYVKTFNEGLPVTWL